MLANFSPVLNFFESSYDCWKFQFSHSLILVRIRRNHVHVLLGELTGHVHLLGAAGDGQLSGQGFASAQAAEM